VELLLAFVIVVALAWLVSAPLRRGDRGEAGAEVEDPRVAELEARKEALYRQIRDAELDRAQGKLSEGDWRRADGELRRDAIEVLKELDRVRESAGAAG
jgi:hypothetical protein